MANALVTPAKPESNPCQKPPIGLRQVGTLCEPCASPMAAFDAFFTRLAQFQVRRAGSIVLFSFALALASFPLILKLKLDTTFEALLPTDKPSVRDLEEIRGRTGG